MTLRLAGFGRVFAIDDEDRYRLDVVRLHQRFRTRHLAVDRERVVHVLDFLAIESLRHGPVEEHLVLIETHVLAVNGIEDAGNQPLFAEPFERVPDLRRAHPDRRKLRGNPTQLHVRRQMLDPRGQDRLHILAMRAREREELDHLDLLAGLDGLRLLEPPVVLARSLLQIGRQGRSRHVGADESQRERQRGSTANKSLHQSHAFLHRNWKSDPVTVSRYRINV